MRIKGKTGATWNVDEQVTTNGTINTKSFVHHIANWDEVVTYLNLSGEYPKGTVTTTRSLNYHQKLNSIAEAIMWRSKGRYKTVSDILRVSLHLGIQILYKMFCSDSSASEKQRTDFFFKQLENTGYLLERAQMVKEVEFAMSRVSQELQMPNTPLTQEEGNKIISDLIASVPAEDRAYVKNHVSRVGTGSNVTPIKPEIMENLMRQVTEASDG